MLVNKKNFGLLCTLLAIITISVWSCKKDEPQLEEPAEANLVVSPSQLRFNEVDTLKFFISTQPNIPVSWQISSLPFWLEASKTNGDLKDSVSSVTLFSNFEGLGSGTHNGFIEVISNGAGTDSIKVSIEVGSHPIIELTNNPLTFTAEEESKQFQIKNTGVGFLHWEVIHDTLPWQKVSPMSGSILQDNAATLTVDLEKFRLPVGDTASTVTIVSNAENRDTIILRTVINVPELPKLELSHDEIILDYFIDTVDVYVKNVGNTSSNWMLSIDDAFATSSLTSGSLDAGDSALVSIYAQRAGLSSGNYSTSLNVIDDNEQAVSSPITLKHYIDDLWALEHKIVDAEYDKVNDLLYAVNQNRQFLKIDPATQSIEVLELAQPGLCVSISKDGFYGVVGHDKNISYIELASFGTPTLISTNYKAFDIVLANNGFAYVFPDGTSLERISCIDLITQQETFNDGDLVHGRTIAKLHPSGNYIYGSNTDLSPSKIEKYDIQAGTATYLYKSDAGVEGTEGGHWMLEDGKNLVTKTRHVLTNTVPKSTDLQNNTQLSGNGPVGTLDHSLTNNRIAAVLMDYKGSVLIPTNRVNLYNGNSLSSQGTAPIPDFLIPDGTGGGNFFKSEGHLGFFNSLGTQYIVLVKVDDQASAPYGWAIHTVDVP